MTFILPEAQVFIASSSEQAEQIQTEMGWSGWLTRGLNVTEEEKIRTKAGLQTTQTSFIHGTKLSQSRLERVREGPELNAARSDEPMSRAGPAGPRPACTHPNTLRLAAKRAALQIFYAEKQPLT